MLLNYHLILHRFEALLCFLKVANDGSIPFLDGPSRHERVHMTYYFTQKFEDDLVTLEIFRDGKPHIIKAPMWVPKLLIPRTLLEGSGGDQHGSRTAPSFIMVGGLVFIKLTREILDSEFNLKHVENFDDWVNRFKLLSMLKDIRKEGEEIIVISQILAHQCNIGYENGFDYYQLKNFNGKTILNMKDLKNNLWNSLDNGEADEELVFDFHNGAKIVLHRQEVLQAQKDVSITLFLQNNLSLTLFYKCLLVV